MNCPVCKDEGYVEFEAGNGDIQMAWCECEVGEQKKEDWLWLMEQERLERARDDYEDMKYQRWKDGKE